MRKVAIVGGGLAGSLAALVARSRGLKPTIFDAGKRSAGGRIAGGRNADSGLQFLLGTDPRFLSVLGLLAREELVAPWNGRFGILGSRGGGFLPAAALASTPIGSMMREGADTHTDKGSGDVDFCGLLGRKADSQPVYVGTPSNASIIPGLCAAAGIDVHLGAKVQSVHLHQPAGSSSRWTLQFAEGASSEAANATNDEFDALILATHDAGLAASAVRTVAAAASSVAADVGGDEAGAEAEAEAVQGRLSALAAALDSQRAERTSAAFTWSGYFPVGFSDHIPFDAVSVPGSPILSFLSRDASKPGRSALASGGGDSEVRGELWTAVSTSDFAAAVLTHTLRPEASSAPGGAPFGGDSGDSERGGSAAAAANEAMTHEVRKLFGPYFAAGSGGGGGTAAGGEPPSADSLAPSPLASAAKRWGAGFAAGTLGLSEESVGLEPWRLAICGDYIARQRSSPAEAAALSGMDAAERVASWLVEPGGEAA